VEEEEAADFVATMPPVATKPPTSITFLALNNDALFCFFSMITSSLRRDRVSLSFLTNVFILLPSLLSCVSNNARARKNLMREKRSDEHKNEREREKKEIQTLNIFKEIQTLNILNTKKNRSVFVIHARLCATQQIARTDRQTRTTKKLRERR